MQKKYQGTAIKLNTYTRLKAIVDANNVPLGRLVDSLINAALDAKLPISVQKTKREFVSTTVEVPVIL